MITLKQFLSGEIATGTLLQWQSDLTSQTALILIMNVDINLGYTYRDEKTVYITFLTTGEDGESNVQRSTWYEFEGSWLALTEKLTS